MSYVKGWNNALDKAIIIVQKELGLDSLTSVVIQKMKELKIYEN